MTDALVVKHKWWRIFSPCLIASVWLFVSVINCLVAKQEMPGLNLFSAFLYGFYLIVLQTIDGILKVWVKPGTLLLWIVEIVLIVGIPPLYYYIAL